MASAMNVPYVTHKIGASTFDIHPRYTNLKAIGKGAYGLVCSATDTLAGNRQVAIKKISKVFEHLIDAKRIMREVKLLRHFAAGGKPHENITDILDLMTTPQEAEDFHTLYIVTELFEADLTRILSSKQALSEQHQVYFVYQLLRGLKYMHSAGVLHRDLKPSNLLVNSNCDLAICDFGLARGVGYETFSEEELTGYVQTRWYRSPELLLQATQYGPAADMWSVGCIFGEILARRPILQGSSSANELGLIMQLLGTPSEEDLMACKPTDEAIRFVKHFGSLPATPLGTLFPSANPLALDLLSKMLQFNPAKRISVDVALQHPFLAELHARAPPATTCHAIFDYAFEGPYGPGGKIPQKELQRLIFEEVKALRKEQIAQLGAMGVK